MLQEISIISRFLRQPRRAMLIGGVAFLLLVGVGIAIGVRGCTGDSSRNAGGTASSQPAIYPSTTRPAISSEAENAPRPVLSLSANGAMECQIYQGWPMTAIAVIAHPAQFGADAPATKLGSANRPWTDSLRLVVTDPGGKEAQWPLKLVRAEPTGSFELHGEDTGRAMWRLSSQDSAGLAPGHYTLRAVLDGEEQLTSRPVVVRVSIEPAQLSSEENVRKQRMLAVEEMQRQDWAGAAKRIDAILAQRPNDIGAWELKGDMMSSQKKLREAVGAYDSAIAAFHRIAKDEYDEPSRALIAKRREAMSQLIEQK